MIPLNPTQLLAPQTQWLDNDSTPKVPFFNLVRALFLRTGGPNGVPFTSGDNITAQGSQGQVVLTNDFNAITSGAGAGVTLAPLQAGQFQIVSNDTTGNINVYPAVNGQIVGMAVNAPFMLTAGTTQFFWGRNILPSGATLYQTTIFGSSGSGGGTGSLSVNPILDVGGKAVVIGDPTSFYYPLFNSTPAHGSTLLVNRIMAGVEALQGTQFNQSPASWVAAFLNGDADSFATIGVTSSIGGYPIVAATRTSDFRSAFGNASAGSGSYILAVNDDLGPGSPIAAGCNPSAQRQSGVGGITEACQCDVGNSGSVVDIDAHLGFAAGTTIGLNITCGAFNSTSAAASSAITFDHDGTGKFRKGLTVTSNTIDNSVGTFGGGILINTPLGLSWQWIDAVAGTVVNEFGATINGAGPINALKAASLGIWPGIGDGSTVTQNTSINTAVTINTICGQITTVSNTWTAGFANGQAFVVNNTQVAAVDCIIANTNGGTGNYICFASFVTSHSFQISLVPLTSQTEAVTVNFMVLKSTIT